MWTSMLQNGRKNKKDESVDKIKQYIRLTDKSSFSSRLSRSMVGGLRADERKNAKDKENQSTQLNKDLGKYKCYNVSLTNTAMNSSILLNKFSKDSQNAGQLLRKNPIKINMEKRSTVLRIKKGENQAVESVIRENMPSSSYFLECLKTKNKIRGEMNTNIHNSILTFKEFLRACRASKEKSADPKLQPQTPGKKTIVFDMDETLIHTNEAPTSNFEIKVPFRSFQGRVGYGYVQVRPYAKELLIKLSKHFDIIIFTASTQAYADPIIDHIDPERVIQHRLYRQSCVLVRNQVFVKDLRIFGRDLSRLVLVDNAPYSYMMQLANGIPILPYYKGKDDSQLIILQEYLMNLLEVEDVRIYNSQHFRLHEYIKFDNHESLIKNLYNQWIK